MRSLAGWVPIGESGATGTTCRSPVQSVREWFVRHFNSCLTLGDSNWAVALVFTAEVTAVHVADGAQHHLSESRLCQTYLWA